MILKERIQNEVKEAMKAKDNARRDALRLLTSAFKQIEVDERIELDDEAVVKIIQKQVKQRLDAAEQFKDAGRDDLYDKEMAEIAFYEIYLPKQLDDAELESRIKAIIAKVGAASMKDIGKVMGTASKELNGIADGKRINAYAKVLLS
ncbi:MAG: GatB/YqeY domain-containing protein [Helicobacteraceae bacterium]|nr:GatB/YqeY domain-containing protein [Helicobacteraceae bacterium]